MPAPRGVGVLGGTFDPVHLGHLVVASEVCAELALDEVLLVPAGRPWQKAHRTLAAAEHRVAMLELAVSGDDRLRVSRVDVDRDGPTYTVDTVRDLRAELGPDVVLHLVLGADALAGLPTWRDVDSLLSQVRVVVCSRPGHPATVPAGLPADRFVHVGTPQLDVSSTDVRARVAAGRPVRYLVPERVEAYLREHDLYGAAA